MRERLTAAFAAITLLVLVGAGVVRSHASDDAVRTHERADAARYAGLVAVAASTALAEGRRVDESLLEQYVGPGARLIYEPEAGDAVSVTAADYPTSRARVVEGEAPVEAGGRIVVSRTHDEALEGVWGGDWAGVVLLFGLLALAAGLVGYAVARNLSGPFRQLAGAAAALGRGRFDLDLPRGGVPEARAIASALESSAEQLKGRLERERDFGLHASHVLRTPLTSLRFHLEDLVGDPDLSPEAREDAVACLRAVAQLNEAASELVELGGRGVLVAGAAVPLQVLTHQAAQRWSDRLGDGRRLTTTVEGDGELLVTPGPVEQVLDVLLEDVAEHESGSVRLVFEGAATRLRIDLVCARTDGTVGAPTCPAQERVRDLLDSVGGRLERPVDADVLRLHLPRR